MPILVLKGLIITMSGTFYLLLFAGAGAMSWLLSKVFAPVPFIGGWVSRHLQSWSHTLITSAVHIWDSNFYLPGDIARIIWAYFSSMFEGIRAALWDLSNAIWRVSNVQIPRVVRQLQWFVLRQSDADRQYTRTEIAGVYADLRKLYNSAIQYATNRFNQAELDIQNGLTALRAYVNTVRKAIIKQVDDEASAGYRAGSTEHQTLIGRVLDLLVTHDPAVKALVSRLAGMILDLIELDQPELRIAASLIVRELVNHFGIDTVLGRLLHDVMSPLIGGAPPATLTDTVTDVCQRLDALEGFRTTFAEDGGQDLLDLGKFLESLNSAGMDAAMVAFLAAAAIDPVATASGTVDAAEPLATAAADALKALLGL